MIPIQFKVENRRPDYEGVVTAIGTVTLQTELEVSKEEIRTAEQHRDIIKAVKNVMACKLHNELYGEIEKRLVDLACEIALHGPFKSEVSGKLNAVRDAIDSMRATQEQLEAMPLSILQ